MKYRILYFIKLPPPITGATLMNQYVVESEILKNSFKIRTIGISYNQSVGQMGDINVLKFLKIVRYSFLLIKELLLFNPDLIYFQISPLGIAFYRDSIYVMIMKLFRKKIVYHLHGKGINNHLNNPIKKKLYKFVLKDQEVITLSKVLDYDIQLIFQKNIYHVPNGLPVAKFNNKERVENSIIKILYLSNLIKSKGILDFIDAMETLKNKGFNFNANIVGKDADLSSHDLTELIKEKELNVYVKYLGAKYGEEKNEIYNKSDIFVFPTKNDTFALVNLEAMQFGLPVISTNEGAIPEIVDDGITGFIVEKNTPNNIAKKIEFLANHPELRKKMGAAGRKKFLEKYTLQVFEKNMITVFNDILKKGNNEKN